MHGAAEELRIGGARQQGQGGEREEEGAARGHRLTLPQRFTRRQ
jgi:hypothetical protein